MAENNNDICNKCRKPGCGDNCKDPDYCNKCGKPGCQQNCERTGPVPENHKDKHRTQKDNFPTRRRPMEPNNKKGPKV